MRDTIEAPNAAHPWGRAGWGGLWIESGIGSYCWRNAYLSRLLSESSPEESLGCHFVGHSGSVGKQCKTSVATKSSWEGKQWTRERKSKTKTRRKRQAKKTKNVQPKKSNKNIHLNAGDDDALKWFGDWFCPLPDLPLLACRQTSKSWQASEQKKPESKNKKIESKKEHCPQPATSA